MLMSTSQAGGYSKPAVFTKIGHPTFSGTGIRIRTSWIRMCIIPLYEIVYVSNLCGERSASPLGGITQENIMKIFSVQNSIG